MLPNSYSLQFSDGIMKGLRMSDRKFVYLFVTLGFSNLFSSLILNY